MDPITGTLALLAILAALDALEKSENATEPEDTPYHDDTDMVEHQKQCGGI